MTQVLLVYADPGLGAQLAATLAEAGLETRVVTSGERAMDRFIQEPCDVVVVDFDLAGRDGITTAEAIRWMPGGRRARVVLTASKEPEDGPLEALGANVGAFAALVGHDADRLRAIVERAAAVEPNTAETRVLSTEHALLEAERRRSKADVSKAPNVGQPPTLELPLTDPLDTPTPLTTDLEDATLDDAVPDSWEWRDTDGRIEGKEVRQLAEDAAETHSSLLGTFDKMSFPKLLHRLTERRATGALICVHPPDDRITAEGTEPTKVVYFRSGVPVHVRSNLLGECLGQVLMRTRKIGAVALKESLLAMRRGEGRQGEVLVEMGAIGPLELADALAEQMRLKLYELFAWRRGTFRFSPDRRPPADRIDLELGLAEITFRGLAATRDPQEILDALEERADQYVIPQARKLVRFLPLSSESGLRSVIRRVDGSRTIGEILSGSGSPGRAAILIHAMACLDAVRFEAEPLRIRDEPSSSLPSVPSAVTPLSTGSIPLRSQPTEAQPDAAEPSLASDEIQTSIAKFPSSKRAVAEPSDVGLDSAAAFAAAAAAAADSSAEPASVHLSPPAPEAPPVPDPDVVTPAASAPRLAEVASPPTTDSSEPPERDATGSGLRTKPGGELDERVERLLKAERRFRRGQRALAKSDLTSAVTAFEEAVQLCPDEAQFVVHLAWARHADAPDDEELLERCLFEVARGCKHSPDLVAAHLFRARLLLAAGRAAEATKSFARVLEIDGDHAEARRALTDLEA